VYLVFLELREDFSMSTVAKEPANVFVRFINTGDVYYFHDYFSILAS
jgi:hypothetical protein